MMLQYLIAEGVTHYFGYPGGAIMPSYDALFNYQDKLNHILTRHRGGTCCSRYGHYRQAGSVLLRSVRAANLITGIADAQIDSTH